MDKPPRLVQIMVCFVLVMTPAAAFAEIVWSCNAMGAVPTPPTLENDLIRVQAGRVAFNEGKTGIANLVCPIGTLTSRMAGPLHKLFVTFNAAVGDGVVEASLRRIDRGTGHVETVENGHATSAGNNPRPGLWTSVQSGELSDSLDSPRFYYYVQITLKREQANQSLAVQGVGLTAD